MRKLFLVFLLPGVVFRSILIAGGYGTGQELSVFSSALADGRLAAYCLDPYNHHPLRIFFVRFVVFATSTAHWFVENGVHENS